MLAYLVGSGTGDQLVGELSLVGVADLIPMSEEGSGT